ncbi:MAG: ABC transporter ATP-binding protein [Candidatus Tectomicrobia bacterium]|nr:ABC transporter ATP-binding protein [Candidatus Tectomicrobia bacterium]
MGVLTTRQVVKRFAGLVAVDHVDLEVQEGEVRGIVGPNGAGKTTLFNLISGFYPVTSGRIEFLGKDITTTSAHRRAGLGIGRTFQATQLFSEMTVLENVATGRHTSTRNGAWAAVLRSRAFRRSLQRDRELAEEIIDFVGLRGTGSLLASSLPYGQQRLVEIARAIVNQPQLLLLDEPAAGMNLHEIEALNELIRKINETRINGTRVTILVVEHNMRVIMNISHRISVLDFGEKIAEGPPKEIQQNERVIAAYLGSTTGGNASLGSSTGLAAAGGSSGGGRAGA